MKINLFNNHKELSDYMIDNALDGLYTVAVLFYEDAIRLTKELMINAGVEAIALDIEPTEYNGYDKEYYVSLNEDMTVFVEPAFVDGRYLDAEADLTLIDGNANSAILKHIQGIKCFEIRIGEKYNDMSYDDFNNCCYCDNNLLDYIFENAKLIKDNKGLTVGIEIDKTPIFEYLIERYFK